MFNPHDEEADDYEALYDVGHWEWNDVKNELVFISHTVRYSDGVDLRTPAILGPIEFKDDIDIVEQHRFKKRFQRKPCGDDDVVLLQDIKDVVLYTTPTNIFKPAVINILHLQTTNRFLRALILYIQYYLQITDEMSRRITDEITKLRTPESLKIEQEYRDNLEELRLLISKEYCTIITGGNDFKKFHHMGPKKKSRSLSKFEAIVFESVLRICIQIVWLALGRKAFNQIELEVHRIFKSSTFNVIEHKLNIHYESKLTPPERFVLMGHCIKHKRKLNTQSPLMNEVTCHRPTDYRLFGLGTIQFKNLTSRQLYLEQILTAKENVFQDRQLTLGIIGLPRSRFDIMLREIKSLASTASSSASVRARSASKQSRGSIRKHAGTTSTLETKLYPDIIFPSKKYDKEWLPCSFPSESPSVKKSDHAQYHKWLARARRRLNAKSASF